jgi:ankyrin repeat protein
MNNPSSIDEYDEIGMTALLYAVVIGDFESVQNLLNEGANPNKPHRDDATATPLWHAEEDFGLMDIGKLLRVFTRPGPRADIKMCLRRA